MKQYIKYLLNKYIFGRKCVWVRNKDNNYSNEGMKTSLAKDPVIREWENKELCSYHTNRSIWNSLVNAGWISRISEFDGEPIQFEDGSTDSTFIGSLNHPTLPIRIRYDSKIWNRKMFTIYHAEHGHARVLYDWSVERYIPINEILMGIMRLRINYFIEELISLGDHLYLLYEDDLSYSTSYWLGKDYISFNNFVTIAKLSKDLSSDELKTLNIINEYCFNKGPNEII